MTPIPPPTVPGHFEERDPEAERVLNDIGKMLRSITPPGYGFAFLMATFGDGGSCFYTSNVDRHDVCNMMREFIKKHEPN